MHYLDLNQQDSTPLGYGIVKFHNSSIGTYMMTPSVSDPSVMTFKFQSIRNVVSPRQISSYHIE